MSSMIIDKSRKATGRVICPDIDKEGSGFFVKDQGLFVTNNHVVHKMTIDSSGAIRVDYSERIYVKIGKNSHRASLVIDKDSDRPVVFDYAILKIDSPIVGFDVVDISQVSQGEKVFAIGYPFSFNEFIVTSGVVSAIVKRPSHINALHKMKTLLTDTLITYGSSGGPLIRVSDGKVIGINTMPHEIKDEARERLLGYIEHPQTEFFPPVRDLIEFVLKYLHIGFNYAISIEYVMADDALKS